MIENRFKKGLGRGLSSLIGDTPKKIETNKISINDLKIVMFMIASCNMYKLT